jgi:hypothetical protein
MRFVPIKSDNQLDLQSLHRVRERWVMRRTAVINQIRGLLLERGITLRLNTIGPLCWSAQLQQGWPANDACLRPGLEIAFAIPTSTDQRLLRG